MALVTVLVLLFLPLPIHRIGHHVIPTAYRYRRRNRRVDHHILAAVGQVLVIGIGHQEEQRPAQPDFPRIGRQIVDSHAKGRGHYHITATMGAIPVTAGVEVVIATVGHFPVAVREMIDGVTRAILRPRPPAIAMTIRAPLPVTARPLPRATGFPVVVIAMAAGNVLVIALAWRLGLLHFVTRIERAARRPLARPFGHGPEADAQPQHTNTCQLPDARLHAVPLGRKYGNHSQSTAPVMQAN